MSLFDNAIIFAVHAHSGMHRKMNNTPYIIHPIEAASIVGTMTNDEEVLAAAVLHDIVEDTNIKAEEIEERFGKRVANLVASETENKRDGLPPEDTWHVRKEESLEELRTNKDINVKMLWLGDKLSNMRAFYREYLKIGDDIWLTLNQKDKKMQEWYYRTIAQLLYCLKDFPAWQEYEKLVNAVFGGSQ